MNWTAEQRRIQRMRNQAHRDSDYLYERSVLELVDRDRWSPPLTHRERIRLAKGYIIAILACFAFVALMGLVGASDLVR